ncbi:hypothetical protein ACFQY4_35565 [Catellatospora bangladeshensis]|uniref:Lipoprotein n=1 Tax=Catellatospora bangladeshensis TaxID=310355 RepID=A0A8J3JB33_9ACTN|nr:hypothetical protein [Catellatospora bangladeshensis]GIF80961.1 hypothetical protein Cba03nite_23100 [Catellatospora bangladeshensis]
MKRHSARVFGAALLLLSLACGIRGREAEPQPPGPEPSQRQNQAGEQPDVTEFGFRGLLVGEVPSGAVERDTGLLLDLRPQDDRCSYAYDGDDGVGVVTDADTLVLAFMINSPAYATYGGVRVGSSIDTVTSVFGANATVLQVRSADGGPLVQVAPKERITGNSRGIYFRTDTAGRVTEIRVGMWPWVEYEQYCSLSAAQQGG